MIQLDTIINQVSKETGIDKEIVEQICKHVFQFTIDVMKDDEDYHDILFNQLFKFKLKGRFKTDKTKKYSPKL